MSYRKLISFIFILLLTNCATTKVNTICNNILEYDSNLSFENILLNVYNMFPNMENNTFLIDKELKCINIQCYSEYITRKSHISKYGHKYVTITHRTKYNIKVRNNKITFFNPEIMINGYWKNPDNNVICEMNGKWLDLLKNF